MNSKLIIYKSLDNYAVTSERNFKAVIQDARRIHYFPCTEWTPQEIIQYYIDNFGCFPDDFIIKM